MSKKLLLTSASVIIFSVATQANPSRELEVEAGTLVKHTVNPVLKESVNLLAQDLSKDSVSPKLPADVIVDFAKFSYSVDKSGWGVEDKTLYNKLINNGWKLDTFEGSTGGAKSQVGSVSGLLAFKDDQVVIATRGTEMTNWNDWLTNIRFSRSPITRFFADEANKLSAITAQFFGGIDGEVANGFLQTHLSSWDYIRKAIMDYAKSTGRTTKELQYTITGHSKGAAKATLNAVNLLTDPELAVGTDYLERSFIAGGDVEGAIDLGASLFHAISRKSEPKNLGNVDTVVFESPRVFSDTAAKQVDAIIGKDNLVRVENKSSTGVDSDPVTHLTPAFLGFEHAGTTVDVDGGGIFVTKHMMGNLEAAAIPAIEKHRRDVATKATQSPVPLAPAKETYQPSLKDKVVDTLTGVKNTISMGASKLMGNIKSAAKSAWNYLWS